MVEIEDKNPSDDFGTTPLHKAAKRGHLLVCKLIIEQIGDINPRDNDGKTPLQMAVEGKHHKIKEFITRMNRKRRKLNSSIDD